MDYLSLPNNDDHKQVSSVSQRSKVASFTLASAGISLIKLITFPSNHKSRNAILIYNAQNGSASLHSLNGQLQRSYSGLLVNPSLLQHERNKVEDKFYAARHEMAEVRSIEAINKNCLLYGQDQDWCTQAGKQFITLVRYNDQNEDSDTASHDRVVVERKRFSGSTIEHVHCDAKDQTIKLVTSEVGSAHHSPYMVAKLATLGVFLLLFFILKFLLSLLENGPREICMESELIRMSRTSSPDAEMFQWSLIVMLSGLCSKLFHKWWTELLLQEKSVYIHVLKMDSLDTKSNNHVDENDDILSSTRIFRGYQVEAVNGNQLVLQSDYNRSSESPLSNYVIYDLNTDKQIESGTLSLEQSNMIGSKNVSKLYFESKENDEAIVSGVSDEFDESSQKRCVVSLDDLDSYLLNNQRYLLDVVKDNRCEEDRYRDYWIKKQGKYVMEQIDQNAGLCLEVKQDEEDSRKLRITVIETRSSSQA